MRFATPTRATRLAAPLCLALSLSACGPDPFLAIQPLAGASANPHLSVAYSVADFRLSTTPGVTYYLVLDANGNPEDGPLVNGPAPLSHPAPDPRAFLPFVRSEADILDREPFVIRDTAWTDYFALSLENGGWTMWQGRRRPDGTVADRHRQLQMGSEWSIQDGRTVLLRLNLSDLQLPGPVPAQLEANIAVTTRKGGNTQRAFLVDFAHPNPRPSQEPDTRPAGAPFPFTSPASYSPDSSRFISIPTNGDLRSENLAPELAIHANVDGHSSALDLVSFTARVGPLPLAP
jgi:hypothetical protein